MEMGRDGRARAKTGSEEKGEEKEREKSIDEIELELWLAKRSQLEEKYRKEEVRMIF
tara:strand:+ start:290 stop:460 length:171 start_codon:yes stop_codon:yes gene_type:complete